MNTSSIESKSYAQSYKSQEATVLHPYPFTSWSAIQNSRPHFYYTLLRLELGILLGACVVMLMLLVDITI